MLIQNWDISRRVPKVHWILFLTISVFFIYKLLDLDLNSARTGWSNPGMWVENKKQTEPDQFIIVRFNFPLNHLHPPKRDSSACQPKMLLMLKLRARCLLGTRDEMFAFLGKVSPAAAGQPCLPAFCPGGRWSVMPANEGKQETHRSLSFASSPSFPDKMSLNRRIQTKNWIGLCIANSA